MIRSRFLALTGMLALIASGAAGAQSTQSTLTVRPESRVILLGRSNVHGWACATSVFDATVVVDSSARHDTTSRLAQPAIRLTVRVPVRSLKCGRTRMNEDMYRALKADEFPDIHYVLDTYVVDRTLSASDSFTVHSVGELTVAGRTQRVGFQVTAERSNGGLRGEAVGHLLMTEFGIKPPAAFLGAIRTKNALVVRVEILVTRNDSPILTR